MTNEEEVKQKIEVFTQFMRGMFNNPNLYVPKEMADKYGRCEELINALPSVTQKPIECDDVVSREAVLDGLKGCICEEWVKTLFATMVKQLPSVTQKSGKWINDKDDIPICSRCGYIPQYDRAIDDYEYSNYCPNCGAKMESEE